MAHLSMKIYPTIDKRNREIEVDYVPVMKKNGVFTGKYITKIIVKQGKTNTLYTTGEDKKIQEGYYANSKIDVRFGYLRIDGGVSKLEG